MSEQLAAGLPGHPRLRQEHPLRVRGQEQAQRPLQTGLPLRRLVAAGRQEPPPGQLPRQEVVIRPEIHLPIVAAPQELSRHNLLFLGARGGI